MTDIEIARSINPKDITEVAKTLGIENKIELEYQADEYAAKMFGYTNAVKAIDEIIAVINKSMKKGVLSNIDLTYAKHIMGKRKRYLMK